MLPAMRCLSSRVYYSVVKYHQPRVNGIECVSHSLRFAQDKGASVMPKHSNISKCDNNGVNTGIYSMIDRYDINMCDNALHSIAQQSTHIALLCANVLISHDLMRLRVFCAGVSADA